MPHNKKTDLCLSTQDNHDPLYQSQHSSQQSNKTQNYDSTPINNPIKSTPKNKTQPGTRQRRLSSRKRIQNLSFSQPSETNRPSNSIPQTLQPPTNILCPSSPTTINQNQTPISVCSNPNSPLIRHLSAPIHSSIKNFYQSPQPTLSSLSKIKSSNNLSNLFSFYNLPLHHSNLLQDSIITPLPYPPSFFSFPNFTSQHPISFFHSSERGTEGQPFPKNIPFSAASSQSDFGSNINITIINFIDNLYNTYISAPILYQVLSNFNLLHADQIDPNSLNSFFNKDIASQQNSFQNNRFTQNFSTYSLSLSLFSFLSSIQSLNSDIKLQIIQQQINLFQSFGFSHLASVLSSKQNLYSDISIFSIRLQNIYFSLCSLFQCIKFPGIQQRSQDWYNIRKSMITASEFGAALGCSPYTTQEQFISKKINPDTPFRAYQQAMDWGIMFEPIINLIYQIKNNTIVFDFGFLIHKNFSFFGASPDGITSEGIMVEFKAPFRRKLSDFFPMQYYYQVQGQLDVCNLLECDYVEARFEPCTYDYSDFIFTIFGLQKYCFTDDDDDSSNIPTSNIFSSSPTNPDIFFGSIVQSSQYPSKKSYKYSSINPTIQQLDHFISSNHQLFQNQGFHLYDKNTPYDPNNFIPTYLFKFWTLHKSNYQSFRIFKNSSFFHSEINKAHSLHKHILQKKQDNITQLPP